MNNNYKLEKHDMLNYSRVVTFNDGESEKLFSKLKEHF